MTRLSEAPPQGAPPFTPEATVGPYYPNEFAAGFGDPSYQASHGLPRGLQGQRVCVSLTVRDAADAPVPFVLLECWQADAAGRYAHSGDPERASVHPGFRAFQRLSTDEQGVATLYSVKPGGHAVPGTSLRRAPHLRLTLFAAGIDRLCTQIFFEGEPENASDAVLQSVLDPMLRKRLVARRSTPNGGDRSGQRGGQCAGDVLGFELPIFLSGDGETPFFDDWSR